MNKERDYFFDNLKAVLIFLVVLGHFLLPIHGESVLVVVKRLIYVFHMPLFVFVSGYFAKCSTFFFVPINSTSGYQITFIVRMQSTKEFTWHLLSSILLYGGTIIFLEYCGESRIR